MALAGEGFLSGIEVSEADLVRWVADKRESLLTTLANLLIAAADNGAFPELESALAQIAKECAPDDRIARARMINLAGLGRDSEALKVYSRHVTLLREELNASPDMECQALAARIARRRAGYFPVFADQQELVEPASSSALPKIILLPPPPADWLGPADAEMARCLVSDLNLQLCRMRTFAMFAPHTARQLSGEDPLLAAAPFGVDYVISTSVLPGARAARLAFNLIEVCDQRIVCADEVLLEGSRLLRSQELIAARLANAIAKQVADLEMRHYRSTGSASAYVQFLLGSNLVQNTDLSLLRRARNHFIQALKLSPDYVPALAALARTLTIEWLLLGRNDRDLLYRAQELANRAVQLDPLSATGYRELGHASLYLGALDESRMHFDTALERAPHYADLLIDQADVLVHSSRPKDAKPLIDKAFMLNPLAPDDYRWIGGSAEFFLGNYDTALDLLNGMQDKQLAGRLIAATAAMAGDQKLATIYKDRWMARYPDFRLKDFASFMPHSSNDDVEHYVNALALAGFR